MTSGGFETILSEADLLAAFRLHARLRRIRPLLIAAGVVSTLLVLLLVASPAARLSATHRPLTLLLEGALGILILLALTAALALRPLWRMQARRTLAQRRDLAEPVQWEFSEAGLRHTSVFSDSTYPWAALREWREDEHVILIYISAQLFYIVPRAAVDPALLEGLRDALVTGGVRKGCFATLAN